MPVTELSAIKYLNQKWIWAIKIPYVEEFWSIFDFKTCGEFWEQMHSCLQSGEEWIIFTDLQGSEQIKFESVSEIAPRKYISCSVQMLQNDSVRNGVSFQWESTYGTFVIFVLFTNILMRHRWSKKGTSTIEQIQCAISETLPKRSPAFQATAFSVNSQLFLPVCLPSSLLPSVFWKLLSKSGHNMWYVSVCGWTTDWTWKFVCKSIRCVAL